MSVLIFANGDMNHLDWVRPYLAEATAVIAADGGARHLAAIGVRPDIVIGDLDSMREEAIEKLASAGAHILRHEREKDETDLELALVFAADHYTADILVFGVLGGRLDQTLANILLLAHPALRSRRVVLMEAFQRAWLVAAAAETKAEIKGEVGDTVSLIPLGGDAVVKRTAGLQWPLTEEILVFGPARGVSNVMTAERAEVVLTSGQVLCIHTRHSWGR